MRPPIIHSLALCLCFCSLACDDDGASSVGKDVVLETALLLAQS